MRTFYIVTADTWLGEIMMLVNTGWVSRDDVLYDRKRPRLFRAKNGGKISAEREVAHLDRMPSKPGSLQKFRVEVVYQRDPQKWNFLKLENLE